MGVSLGFGIGPVRFSTRLRGPKLPQATPQARRRAARIAANSATTPRPPQTTRANMTAEELRTAHLVDWVLVGGASLFALMILYPAPLIPVAVFLAWRAHRAQRARRGAPTVTPQSAEQNRREVGRQDAERALRVAWQAEYTVSGDAARADAAGHAAYRAEWATWFPGEDLARHSA